MTQQSQTETGIDISNYMTEKTLGQAKIIKPIKESANYLYVKAVFDLAMVNGTPVATEQPPIIKNINRASIAEVEAQLVSQEAAIAKVRQQLVAIAKDMDALDLL